MEYCPSQYPKQLSTIIKTVPDEFTFHELTVDSLDVLLSAVHGGLLQVRFFCIDYGSDPHPRWQMEFRWTAYQRHMFGESACPAYWTKPGGSQPSTSVSENCHNTHSDPWYDHTPIYPHLSHTVNMHSSTRRHVKANRETHIGTQVCGHKHLYKNRKKTERKREVK